MSLVFTELCLCMIHLPIIHFSVSKGGGGFEKSLICMTSFMNDLFAIHHFSDLKNQDAVTTNWKHHVRYHGSCFCACFDFYIQLSCFRLACQKNENSRKSANGLSEMGSKG